jgi:hypothetical protein
VGVADRLSTVAVESAAQLTTTSGLGAASAVGLVMPRCRAAKLKAKAGVGLVIAPLTAGVPLARSRNLPERGSERFSLRPVRSWPGDG